MNEKLLNVSLNEIRALQREIQGLKNHAAAQDRRIRILESGVADTVADFPRHVPGTKGRGIQYKLSDGTVMNAGKAKAVKAEQALHG